MSGIEDIPSQDRGTGSGNRLTQRPTELTSSTSVSQDVDRAIVPNNRRLITRTPEQLRRNNVGVVPDDFDIDRARLNALISQRETALNEMAIIFRRTADKPETRQRLQTEHQTVDAQRRRFSNQVRQFNSSRTSSTQALAGDARRRILDIFDESYLYTAGTSRRSSSAWNKVRRECWKAFYQSSDGKDLVNQLRNRSVNGQSLLEITDIEMEQGRAPRILVSLGGTDYRYEVIDVEHTLPRGRVPFAAFEPNNLHLATASNNRRPLNRISATSVFRMGRQYGATMDEIETFVQHHQLSRRQRPISERRRRPTNIVGNTSRVVAVFLAVLAVNQASALADAGEAVQNKLALLRSAASRARRFRAGMILSSNIERFIREVFPPDPLNLLLTEANSLGNSIEGWSRMTFDVYSGSDAQEWERTLVRIRQNGNLNEAVETLNHIGRPNGQDLTLIGQVVPGNTVMNQIQRSLSLTTSLLSDEEQYQTQADFADELSLLQQDEIIQGFDLLIQAAAVPIALELRQHGRLIAAQYRTYVSQLRDIQASLTFALNQNQLRSEELLSIINEIDASG
jgi:hypothetical protein